ncbi:CheR family methyltransferase [Aliterella atlantica]|uniref:Chemotaxis protein CheR n=1 Tax=Aliterella atlantica CENA595 TaxID=1618023 RepID=A0A0D8ZVK0_9CYAN|nr:protein-glutamate O-methyltransferase CheR [Aliterella atlantica]KJH72417.1 chemotaxis protein CheR [Aliterella atlantica CENA595]
MNPQRDRSIDLETVEIELLLEGVFRVYGYDFRNYAPASLKRRIWHTIRRENLTTISALQDKILHDSACLERFVLNLSINVTSMFRDPSFYLALRTHVVPLLRTYPFIRIWHAGCATGEEVYSMAILLQEENLYHRCRLYATDINEEVIKKAKTGIFPVQLMQEYTQNYLQAGGKRSFSEYYTAAYNSAIFRTSLKENMVFSQHNLVTDSSFNEFHVILCRNVLIYFNQELQAQVYQLFHESLINFGILGLGKPETLKFTAYEQKYQQLVATEKLYRRVS